MCGDHRLKLRTRQAYGKKRKRAWNKGLKVPIDSVPHPSELSGDDPVDTDPEGADLEAMPSTSGFDGNRIDTDPVNTDPEGADLEAMPSTSGFDGNRIDTVYYTAEEQSEALEGAEEKKRHLASQSASQRKFDLLNVNLESTEIESGTEFVIVDMQVLNAFFFAYELQRVWCEHRRPGETRVRLRLSAQTRIGVLDVPGARAALLIPKGVWRQQDYTFRDKHQSHASNAGHWKGVGCPH
ncbi:unnamed protein product [Ixodes hexagonus]